MKKYSLKSYSPQTHTRGNLIEENSWEIGDDRFGAFLRNSDVVSV